MRLGYIAEANGITIEQLRQTFGLGVNVTADTPRKDVKAKVGRVTELMQDGAGLGEGMGEGEEPGFGPPAVCRWQASGEQPRQHT